MAGDTEPAVEKPAVAVSRRDNLHPIFFIACVPLTFSPSLLALTSG